MKQNKTEKKISVLISYPSMMIGGSTTSLLSILSRLDYSRYEVDLLLDVAGGELLDLIPSEVNILEGAYKYPCHRTRKIHNLLNLQYVFFYLKSKIIAKKSGNYKHGIQYLEMKDVENYRRINRHYDVAISFLEGRNCKFVAKHVSASKKIGWIHIDYKASGFDPKFDLESMSCFDYIVTVSKKCKDAFVECFPSLKNRTCVVENILSAEIIRRRSCEKTEISLDNNCFNLVTACRIVFSSKGLDRAVEAMNRLKTVVGFKNLKWYIIGDGPDMRRLKDVISTYSLDDNIILLGNKTNPYPYLKSMDVFFLPSIWEGKPMAVTEAFMLGLPVLATNYSSATEQIRNHIDGIIVDNSTEGIESGLRLILSNQEMLKGMRDNVRDHDYSNDSEMQKIVEMLEN